MRHFRDIRCTCHVVALTLAACSGSHLTPASVAQPAATLSQAAVADSSHAPRNDARPHPDATPITFHFTTVNYPLSTNNRVTGINDTSRIVGTFTPNGSAGLVESYISQPPYEQFKVLAYSGANTTYASGIADEGRYIAGYVIGAPSENGTMGFIYYKGKWSLYSDPNEGRGSAAVTELLGVMKKAVAVGFYENASGTDVAFELSFGKKPQYSDLGPPGFVSSEATGINGKNPPDFSGFGTLASSVTLGFCYCSVELNWYTFSYALAKSTEALGINWQSAIVGDYVDQSGVTHGYILREVDRGSSGEVWESVDEPNAAGTTVITSINQHYDISGYYIDKSGNENGFVATPTASQ